MERIRRQCSFCSTVVICYKVNYQKKKKTKQRLKEMEKWLQRALLKIVLSFGHTVKNIV